MTDYGTLTVRVGLGSGAYPIEGATVHIKGSDDDNADVVFSLETNRDGKTESVRLPTPKKSLSLVPDPASRPYSTYTVGITKSGFYPLTITDVAMFPGIFTTLPVNMIPLAEFDSARVYPRDTLNPDTSEDGTLGGDFS
ncbi:MAG TPA: hypothetical protein DDY70_00130 [Clostridiales bacterium]|nr:hypothetical protein [Clostridiales bacterium]